MTTGSFLQAKTSKRKGRRKDENANDLKLFKLRYNVTDLLSNIPGSLQWDIFQKITDRIRQVQSGKMLFYRYLVT